MDIKELSERLVNGKPVCLDGKPYSVVAINELLHTVDLQNKAGNSKTNIKYTEVKSHE